MKDRFTYLVLGAGRQGSAAAYDMARWGEAERVLVADQDADTAQSCVERVNKLIGRQVVLPLKVDASKRASLTTALKGVDACLSAVPYYLNLEITRLAVEQGVSVCDLGGNIDIARQQHGFDESARAAGISIIPNCGQVPGMGTSLMVYAMEMLDEPVDVFMWDGGNPQKPQPPFNYLLTFHIAGLTNEYAEPAIFIRDWKITQMDPLCEVEHVAFPPPIGKMEAFVAGGGTDTMPWTYEGKLRTLQNLTLRYPGHYAQLKAYYDLGLWDTNPMQIGDQQVVPREVFHALFEPKVLYPEDKDLVIVRVRALGKKDGRQAEAFVQVIDYFDDATGFSAMERGTGWSAAIVAHMMARHETPRGAGGVEKMVPAKPFVEALKARGIPVEEHLTLG
ncbi:MAG: saccharopine dehydrogenase NADP-binding domain-containing protein [Anaerolineales bacterium]|nr:MAG: saccharopine dehydrogenase NADP-binding domain-containing protein [Anaerolineales bacterium]